MIHARPTYQARLRERLEAWATDFGGLPDQNPLSDGRQLRRDLRRAYVRGTLRRTTENRLRELGADDRWFAPHQVAASDHLAATVAYVTIHQRWPRERERASGLPVGRWLRELRRRSRLGTLSQRDARAIEALKAVAAAHGVSADPFPRCVADPDDT